jgi:hypothetical protein
VQQSAIGNKLFLALTNLPGTWREIFQHFLLYLNSFNRDESIKETVVLAEEGV